jgi:hypothetical protein
MTYKIEVDSHSNCYLKLIPYLTSLKNVEGLSCEVGVRAGGGSLFFMKTFLQNSDNKTHICIDPYGQIDYTDKCGTHTTDYTNNMRNNAFINIYSFALQHNADIVFFNMEDSEFYKRFFDGVPIYKDRKKEIVNSYSFVHIDGQHEINSVMVAAQFFSSRISKNGIIVFDNTDDYNHQLVEGYLLNNNFVFCEEIVECHRKVYKKV